MLFRSLVVEASGPFESSEIARVLDMVERAAANKSPVERFISHFAAWYTPAIFGVALLTLLVPPLVLGGGWREWFYRSLVVLMVSCPCALVISVPLGYFGGIGAASRRGILVKGGSVLDAMSGITAVAFDKTGTLTEGVLRSRPSSPQRGWRRRSSGRRPASPRPCRDIPWPAPSGRPSGRSTPDRDRKSVV